MPTTRSGSGSSEGPGDSPRTRRVTRASATAELPSVESIAATLLDEAQDLVGRRLQMTGDACLRKDGIDCDSAVGRAFLAGQRAGAWRIVRHELTQKYLRGSGERSDPLVLYLFAAAADVKIATADAEANTALLTVMSALAERDAPSMLVNCDEVDREVRRLEAMAGSEESVIAAIKDLEKRGKHFHGAVLEKLGKLGMGELLVRAGLGEAGRLVDSGKRAVGEFVEKAGRWLGGDKGGDK